MEKDEALKKRLKLHKKHKNLLREGKKKQNSIVQAEVHIVALVTRKNQLFAEIDLK